MWEWQGTLSRNRIKDIISTRGCKKSVGGGEEKGPGLIYCESLLLQLLQPRWPETKLAKAKVDQFRPIHTKYLKTRTSVNNAKDWLDQLFLIPCLKRGITYMNVITMGQSTTISCSLGHFRHCDKHPTTGQLGDPRASLLLTSEKVVLCEIEKGRIKTFVQSMEKLGTTSWPWCFVLFEEAAMTGWRKWSG